MTAAPRTALGRIYASKRGHAEVVDWHLPGGVKYVLQVRTLRGSTFGHPKVSARLYDDSTGDLTLIESIVCKADELNAWLKRWSLTL